MYFLKLYDKSIVMLLRNDLTNICSEISKIRLFYEWFIATGLYLECGKVR